MRARSAFAGDYASATALHLQFPSIGQGEATSVLQPHAIRLAGAIPAVEAFRAARALEVWRDGQDSDEAASAVADSLAAIYAGQGLPTRLRDLGVERTHLAGIAAETVKNFNASAGLGAPEDRVAHSLKVLEAAW